MTDEQIVKGLECCVEGDTFCYECGEDCPFIDVDMCTVILRRETLDLIKRQQAEIKELQEILGGTSKVQSQTCAVVRAETVREFAKRLTEHSSFCVAKSGGKEMHETKAYTIRAKIIDKLVREMTEKEGGMG